MISIVVDRIGGNDNQQFVAEHISHTYTYTVIKNRIIQMNNKQVKGYGRSVSVLLQNESTTA